MSGRRPGQQALEVWTKGYLQKLSKSFNRRSEAKYIEKAIMMVNIVFGEPCCSDPENLINLITPNDNTLTHTFRQLLHKEKITRREYRLSLLRILDMLNHRLYGDCCDQTITFTYEGVSPANVTAQFFDLVTGDPLFATTISGGTVQQFVLPAKYFGAASLIQVQLTVSVAPPSLENYTLSDQNFVVYAQATSLGITASQVFNPLQPNYVLQLL
jgi:hypothetical protein